MNPPRADFCNNAPPLPQTASAGPDLRLRPPAPVAAKANGVTATLKGGKAEDFSHVIVAVGIAARANYAKTTALLIAGDWFGVAGLALVMLVIFDGLGPVVQRFVDHVVEHGQAVLPARRQSPPTDRS